MQRVVLSSLISLPRRKILWQYWIDGGLCFHDILLFSMSRTNMAVFPEQDSEDLLERCFLAAVETFRLRMMLCSEESKWSNLIIIIIIIIIIFFFLLLLLLIL